MIILAGFLIQGSSCIRYDSNLVLSSLKLNSPLSITADGLSATALRTPVPRLTASPGAVPDSGTRTRSYLALGDSYTIGQSVAPEDRYPVQLVKKLNEKGIMYADPEIIATSGWTTTNLLNALQNKKTDTPYDLVTLLIGVNNQYQRKTQAQYQEEFASLLHQAIGLAGDNRAHVIVLSIPDYTVTPFARFMDKPLVISQLDSFNRINKEISKTSRVRYLDITWESRKAADDPSLIAEDGLHFSGKEYEIWAAMIEKTARRN